MSEHDSGCPVAGWERRAIDHLIGVAEAAVIDADAVTMSAALVAAVEAVWAELVDAPIATGDHPGRDLAVYYAVSGIGQQLIGDPPPPGKVAVIPQHHLVSFFMANLDRLRLVNSTPDELAAT